MPPCRSKPSSVSAAAAAKVHPYKNDIVSYGKSAVKITNELKGDENQDMLACVVHNKKVYPFNPSRLFFNEPRIGGMGKRISLGIFVERNGVLIKVDNLVLQSPSSRLVFDMKAPQDDPTANSAYLTLEADANSEFGKVLSAIDTWIVQNLPTLDASVLGKKISASSIEFLRTPLLKNSSKVLPDGTEVSYAPSFSLKLYYDKLRNFQAGIFDVNREAVPTPEAAFELLKRDCRVRAMFSPSVFIMSKGLYTPTKASSLWIVANAPAGKTEFPFIVDEAFGQEA